jgi:drug/metabolite transporter (DMT)-like permease
MSKKSAILAIVIFGLMVVLTYLFVPPGITRNPLLSLLLVVVLLISTTLIRRRLRKAPGYNQTVELVSSLNQWWRPPLWLGVALIAGSFIWLFAALIAGGGSGSTVVMAFIPSIIAIIGGCVIFGIRFTGWFLTLIFKGD